MATRNYDNFGPFDSILENLKDAFATSSVFFITLGLLIMLSRLFVRLATGNYRGMLTSDQTGLIIAVSIVLAFAHLFLSVAYTFHDVTGFATAPSYYLAVCWSMATLSGVCGGLGIGLLMLIGMMRAI
jgi:hypothetical protein